MITFLSTQYSVLASTQSEVLVLGLRKPGMGTPLVLLHLISAFPLFKCFISHLIFYLITLTCHSISQLRFQLLYILYYIITCLPSFYISAHLMFPVFLLYPAASMNIASTGAIIGGVIAALIVLVVIIYCCCCRKKKGAEEEYTMGWIFFLSFLIKTAPKHTNTHPKAKAQ